MNRVAWIHRLSTRLAVLIAVLMTVFAIVSQLVHERVLESFETPEYDDVLFIDELDALTHTLLDDALVDDRGQLIPTERSIRDVDHELQDVHAGFLWFALDGKLLAWSEGLEWIREVEADRDFVFPDEEVVVPSDSWHDVEDGFPSLSQTVERHGKPVGIFSVLTMDEAWAEFDPEATWWDDGYDWESYGPPIYFADEEAYRTYVRHHRRIAAMVSSAIILIASLIVGFLVSRLVTRRIKALTETASEEGPDLPGPFESRGRDEIALLAKTMNGMRDRVESLVNGMNERDAQRREWIAQVSHDLRTPLTALIACLDRARVRASRDPLSPELEQTLDILDLDAQRMRTLSDDLLDLARLDLPESSVREPVPVGEVARQVVRSLKPLAQSRGLELDLELEAPLPTLDADGRLLSRALENLVRNAIDYASHRIVLGVRANQDGTRFDVADDGPGFRNLPDPASSRGLGIKLARRVAALHNGRFEACNAPSSGALVSLIFPSAR